MTISHPSLRILLLQQIGKTNDRNVFWACRDENNFGDWIGPSLFEKLSRKEPIYCQARVGSPSSIYFTVGSIFHHIRKPNVAIIWGSGIIDSQTTFEAPKRICSVRGPLTRDRCLALGYECPPIYGDPALLMPLFEQSIVKITYEIGIVPHMVDFELAKKLYRSQNVKIIDVRKDCREVISDIRSCSCIASSSLHGIIIAHAYGIPAVHLPLSNKLKGDGVKFRDYYGSFDTPLNEKEYTISPEKSVADLISRIHSTALPDIDLVQEKLLDACPFRIP